MDSFADGETPTTQLMDPFLPESDIVKQLNSLINSTKVGKNIDDAKLILAAHPPASATGAALRATADFDSQHPSGGPSPAVFAAAHGDTASLRLLLAAGCRVESVSHGEGLLLTAVDAGSEACVAVLLAHGVDVNATSAQGAFPLAVAVDRGNASLIRQLLAAGADVNMPMSFDCGRTCAHAACAKGDAEALALLLAAGADADAADAAGHTAAFSAAAEGHEACLVLLLANGADADRGATAYGFTPLHVASANGETGVVELLLGHGADASLRSTRAFFDAPPGSTALSLERTARGPNHARVVALLEGGGAAAAASSAPAEPLVRTASTPPPPMLPSNFPHAILPIRPPRHR
ncbi:hypothetical protein JL722_2068 [Aureococcus anophagefferens]|nr:hypothetical protein JL722_2068 [Aureococcus anophagefferens]